MSDALKSKIQKIFTEIYFRFDGTNFESITSSEYDHGYTDLASYMGRPFVTGSSYGGWNKKTEIMNMASGNYEWESGPDFPYLRK